MKTILFCLALVACSAEPKTPVVCQQNLQFCSSEYKTSSGYTSTQWNALCLQDLKVCKAGWGMQ